jgi:hypothetical protein
MKGGLERYVRRIMNEMKTVASSASILFTNLQKERP